MTMTDPIADMLTRIRNANTAMHDTVKMPTSKLKESLADILEARGVHRRLRRLPVDHGPGQRPRDQAQVRARPDPHDRRPAPRVQARSPYLRGGRPDPACLGGMGVAVVSTSQGLMTDREARERRVGGEVLCYVW